MSTADPIAVVLADVDRPVQPRFEFVEALLSELLAEIPAPAIAPRMERSRVWPGWFFPNRSRWSRFAIAAVVIGLLLAGVAAATYLGVRLVYETPATTLGSGGEDGWASFALAPGGHDLYAIRVPRARPLWPGTGEYPVGSVHSGAPQLVRIDGIDRSGALQPQLVLDLDFADLAKQGVSIQTGSGGAVAVADNGDLFLDVPAHGPGEAPGEALFVLHPAGSTQQILDAGDLAERNLFPFRHAVFEAIAASAPDRAWVWVGPSEGTGPQRVFELIDPNADGDWSDVVVRPIALPDSLPYAKEKTVPFAWHPAWEWQLAAEPSLPGTERSRSVLAGVLFRKTGEFRIYRIGDLNDDGDALDPGEVTLLYDRPNGLTGEFPLVQVANHFTRPRIAPLVVTRDGVAHEEIAVAGLESADRISLLSDSGAVSEIPDTFPNSTDWPANGLSVVGDARGDLYAIVATRSSSRLVWTVYKLDAGEARKTK